MSWRVNGCLAVAGFAATLYLNSLSGEFVFDDHEAIENNADVRYIGIRTSTAYITRNIHLYRF